MPGAISPDEAFDSNDADDSGRRGPIRLSGRPSAASHLFAGLGKERLPELSRADGRLPLALSTKKAMRSKPPAPASFVLSAEVGCHLIPSGCSLFASPLENPDRRGTVFS